MLLWAKLANPNVLVNSDGKIFRVHKYRPYNNTPCAYVGGMKEVPTRNNDGYAIYSIDGKNYRVHRLVAEAFLGICPKDKVVDHKNRDRSDNRLENLRYVSISENNTNSERSLNCKYHTISEANESTAVRKNLADRGFYRTMRNGKYIVLPLSERKYKTKIAKEELCLTSP